VIQLLIAWLFETKYFAALGIDSGHYVADGPVLAAGVHCLKDQKQGVSA
jgi:hypothetical protein